jgi:hypothetical protein
VWTNIKFYGPQWGDNERSTHGRLHLFRLSWRRRWFFSQTFWGLQSAQKRYIFLEPAPK